MPVDVKEIFIWSSFLLLHSLMRELKKKRELLEGSTSI